ncbi:Uncharacterised protein at_DN0429 [Pycnogonum litorale]
MVAHESGEGHIHFLYQPTEVQPALKNGVRRWLRTRGRRVQGMKQSLWASTVIEWLKYVKHEDPANWWTNDHYYGELFKNLDGGEEAKENQLEDRQNKKRKYARQQKHGDLESIEAMLDNTTAKSLGQLTECINEEEKRELFSIPGWKDDVLETS